MAIDEKPSGHLVLSANFTTASILRALPGPIHEALNVSIGNSVLGALKNAVKDDTSELFDLRTNSRVPSASKTVMKVPDILINHSTFSKDYETLSDQPVFICEVGFREAGPQLEESIEGWFKAYPQVKTAFLIKFDEKPRFYTKPAFAQLPEYVLSEPGKYCESAYKISGESGQFLQLHGVNFVGRVTGYLEVWKRDPDGKKVARSGERILFYDSYEKVGPLPKLEFDVSEFIELSDKSRGGKVEINWEEWHRLVVLGRGRLAKLRLVETLKKHHPHFKKAEKKGDSLSQSKEEGG
ncbi:hypothetical protein McanMca71_000186 [Microsporum canis]